MKAAPRSAERLEAEAVLEPVWRTWAETVSGAAGRAEAQAAPALSGSEAARRACPIRRPGPGRQSREQPAAGAGPSGAMAVAVPPVDSAWGRRPAARTGRKARTV